MDHTGQHPGQHTLGEVPATAPQHPAPAPAPRAGEARAPGTEDRFLTRLQGLVEHDPTVRRRQMLALLRVVAPENAR